MTNYEALEAGNYYLIQLLENSGVELVYVPLVTEKCVLVEYQDSEQTLAWYRKGDDLFEIVEQLTDDQAVIYESLFDDDDDDAQGLPIDWLEDDEDDDLWEEGDEEDEEEGPAKTN